MPGGGTGHFEVVAAVGAAAGCCWSPIAVIMHACRSPLLSTSIPASEKHCIFELLHNKRRCVSSSRRLAKQQRSRFYCEDRAPRACNVVWRRRGCSRSAGAAGTRLMGALVGRSGNKASWVRPEAHECRSARTWSLKRDCYRVVVYVWTEDRRFWCVSWLWAKISLRPLEGPPPKLTDTPLAALRLWWARSRRGLSALCVAFEHAPQAPARVRLGVE